MNKYFSFLAFALFLFLSPLRLFACADCSQELFLMRVPRELNLDKVKMRVVKTSQNAAINQDTILVFSQMNGAISANYSGGKIRKGFLVGRFVTKNQLTFTYCQTQKDGTVVNGVLVCDVAKSENGKITLTEHSELASQSKELGTNIFQEI